MTLQLKNFLLKENFATNFKEANSIINTLDKLKLLHHLMRVCPLPDLQFESFFVSMRSLILSNLDNFDATPEFIYFLSTLSFTVSLMNMSMLKKIKRMSWLRT